MKRAQDGVLLIRLEEGESSKKIQKECPEREENQMSTVFQKPVKTLFQKKELIKSKRSSKMVLKSILSSLST